MLNIDIYKLYNPEIKQEFLNNFDGTNDTVSTLYYTLKKASVSEKEANKDLFEMTANELDIVFHTASRRTENSVRGFISNIMTYIKWATDKGYRSTNLPVYTADSISSKASEYVCKTAATYYTQEELMEYYKKITNRGDVLILQCIFEGIRGRGYSEIFNLKADDLSKKDGKFYVNLYDTEKGTEREDFEISEFLYELMLEVEGLTSVYTITNRKVELVPSQYILKKTSKGNRGRLLGEKLTTSYLNNKNIQYKEVFNSDDFKYKDIERSGVMHYLSKLMKTKETNIVGNEEYIAISDRFSIGKYFHSHYEKEVVNYSAIKGMIDEDFYEEHYGEIKLS
ncbi:hypothetical protein M3649_03700 [Ureibacillus chungkukjangi]|uniref:phage lytic cycle repressor MrpR family protein n=1 Tax=Ureibacillus chungkukjangi TaxID=1202712 RepID=UPI00203E2872|nr:hypothetical protein [Ureibacillus chungkukjangi]MCM3387235.1 hypothetical protein [Ureibacillus chungkukjangi]